MKGAYGLAGVYFGSAIDAKKQPVRFFAITTKWRKDFISNVVNGKNGKYRILWSKQLGARNGEDSGKARLQISGIIFGFFLIYSVSKPLMVNNLK